MRVTVAPATAGNAPAVTVPAHERTGRTGGAAEPVTGHLTAQVVVPTPREELYGLLADLRAHWRLAGRWVQPLDLSDHGGVVRVHGPLGLRRTVTTRLLELRAPALVAGEATAGRTRAAISWTLEQRDGGTLVTLSARLLAVSATDRTLLALGGRRWLVARLRTTLERLD